MGGWQTPEQRKLWESKNREKISQYHKTHRKKHKAEGKCVSCGKPASEDKTYCQTCLDLIAKRSNERYYRLSEERGSSLSAILKLQWKTKFILRLGGKCEKCGVTEPLVLTFHHKNPKTKKNEHWWIHPKEFAEQIESKEIVLLCANCHILEHSKSKYSDCYKGRGHGEKRREP
jgi:hypothetical protein